MLVIRDRISLENGVNRRRIYWTDAYPYQDLSSVFYRPYLLVKRQGEYSCI